MFNRYFASVITALSLFITPEVAGAETKQYQYIGLHVPSVAFGLGINNKSDVAGFYRDSFNQVHGFQQIGGVFSAYDMPDTYSTALYDVNDARVELGLSKLTSTAPYQAFLRTAAGVVTFLPTAPNGFTDVVGVSLTNNGTVAGYLDAIDSGDAPSQPFIYHDGAYSTPPGHPGATQTYFYDMSDAGRVVGVWRNANGQSGFWWEGGVYTDLGNFLPNGINNENAMVGTITNGQGVVRDADGITVIAYPGADSSAPIKINDEGVIVGDYKQGNIYSVFIAVPVSGTFTMADAARALVIAAGIAAANSTDVAHLNVETGGTSASGIDMKDAARLVRKAAGLDP